MKIAGRFTLHRLVIESSTNQASIALFKDGDLLAEEIFAGGRGPVSHFFSVLENLVGQVPTIDDLVVGVGPGSYSGIRIGISAAIGLQIGRGIVARGIHSALGYDGSDFQVVLDARGSFIYTVIRQDRLVASPIHYTREELLEKIDPALPIYSPNILPGFDIPQTFPQASNLGKRLATGLITADLPLVPLYLKPPHITVAKTKL